MGRRNENKQIGLLFSFEEDEQTTLTNKQRNVEGEIGRFDEKGCITLPTRFPRATMKTTFYGHLTVSAFERKTRGQSLSVFPLLRYRFRNEDVDLSKAESMTATLQRITDHLGRLNRRLGCPKSFGACMERVAQAIGATAVVLLFADGAQEILAVADGVIRLDQLVAI